MKRILGILLTIALSVSMFAGCGGGKPAEVKEGGANGLLTYLAGKANEEYLLTENAELDLSNTEITADRTVLLKEGVTLKFTGVLTAGKGCITVRTEYDNDKKSTLDLSALTFDFDKEQEIKFFEVRSDVELISPQPQEQIAVDTSNDEWASVKTILLQDDGQENGDNNDPNQSEDEPNAANRGVETEKAFLEALADGKVSSIDIYKNITVNFNKTPITHNVTVSCNNYKLTLSGELSMQGGVLDIGDGAENKNASVDVSGLKVTFEPNLYPDKIFDIFFIGLNFKQITGKPSVGEGLTYEIPDNGSHASVKIKEVTTPEQHEAKLTEDMTQYLSGVDFPGSVTFDGGHYSFELARDSSGAATVDITGLEINGTKELGTSKSPDIFKITGNEVDFKFNEKAPHVEVVQNEHFWLRYVQ